MGLREGLREGCMRAVLFPVQNLWFCFRVTPVSESFGGIDAAGCFIIPDCSFHVCERNEVFTYKDRRGGCNDIDLAFTSNHTCICMPEK